MFWGILLLVVGLLIIIQHVFNINLPIIKILFGVLLIYFGLKLIFGSFGVKISGFKNTSISSDTEAVFAESEFKITNSDDGQINTKYTTAFGNSRLDLTSINPNDLQEPIKITNAFGRTRIKTNPDHAILAKISVGFGTVKIRGQKLGSLGEIEYKSDNLSTNANPPLRLEIDNAFGDIEIE